MSLAQQILAALESVDDGHAITTARLVAEFCATSKNGPALAWAALQRLEQHGLVRKAIRPGILSDGLPYPRVAYWSKT